MLNYGTIAPTSTGIARGAGSGGHLGQKTDGRPGHGSTTTLFVVGINRGGPCGGSWNSTTSVTTTGCFRQSLQDKQVSGSRTNTIPCANKKGQLRGQVPPFLAN